MGLDPALAAALELGERAAAELAAIPDSEALRMADEAITRSDPENHGEAWRKSQAQLAWIAINMGVYKGPQPDFANASLTELVAFCVAIEKLAWDQ